VRRSITSRAFLTAVAGATLALSFAPTYASVTPVRITCAIAGSANFTPGVKLTARPLHYTFSGGLSNCKTQGVSLKSAAITASGNGSLSCATGSSTGSATIHWNTGKTSYAAFTTNDIGALVRLQGSVTSGYLTGLTFKGALAFEANPVSCVAGLATAKFNGAVSTL